MRILAKDTPQKIGETVILIGWVGGRRDHGKLIFIDLRDRWGIVQVVFTPADKELLKQADALRPEWVVKIDGTVKARPKGMENPELPTGHIEIEAKKLQILAESKTPPFALDTDGREIGEEHRMQYRYLDLRRERMKNNLVMRDKVISFIRDYLHKKDFIEIETPILTKSTPEGARDYVVPSRLYPGKFYALPQSPQQYKQLLMVAGIEKYFQIARCFRDEDTRGDRQPEFTQLDLEMSFVEREDVMKLMEGLVKNLVKEIAPEKKIIEEPFPRFEYKQAITLHGSDRPDLRNNHPDKNELAFCWVYNFPVFETDKVTGKITYSHNPFTAPQFFDEQQKNLFYHGEVEAIAEGIRAGSFWPSQQYDLVLNGYEIGGGGIRIHEPEMLQRVFKILGHSDEKIEENFGHMLNAFLYGVPPHGGMAWGLERLIMLLAGEPNIREVIAFPKTGDGRDLMMDAPAEISATQLRELGLELKKEK